MFSQSYYILINFIILDNSAIINLINNKTKFKLESFVKVSCHGVELRTKEYRRYTQGSITKERRKV
jgi:hypothetical protein